MMDRKPLSPKATITLLIGVRSCCFEKDSLVLGAALIEPPHRDLFRPLGNMCEGKSDWCTRHED